MHISAAAVHDILFVCTGNICRSPMAEGQLKNLIEKDPVPGIKVTSAGLIALPGNPASFNAVRVAQEHGISLQDHGAQPLSSALVAQADLILVMEPRQGQEILARHPEASDKVLHLRYFARYGSRERLISDPYGLSLEAYRFCWEDIRECVESLHHWLLEASRTNE
jgi:protein-tyrosine phosphatase/ribose 5-phosphate isomerase B